MNHPPVFLNAYRRQFCLSADAIEYVLLFFLVKKEKIAMLQRIGFETRAIGDSEFVEQMKNAPVWIEHSPSVSMDEIVCCMERLKLSIGLGLTAYRLLTVLMIRQIIIHSRQR